MTAPSAVSPVRMRTACSSGTTVKIGLAEKVRFEIAVSDEFVQPTVEALCEGARTGEVGDGKIFVLPLDQAVRIRTGETDHGAVTPVDK